MKYDVFISYSRKDFDEVSSLIETIRTEIPDLSAWFDVTGIESGDEFEDKIISAIDNSSYVLFALSENSLASQWTKDEVMYARNTDKKVIPILLKGAQLKGWFLFKFGRIDCIDSTDDIQMKKLMRDLSRWRGLSLRNVRGESGSLNDIKESKVIVDATGTGYSNGMLRVKGIEYPMVYVAGGSFMMGSDDSDARDNEIPIYRVMSSYYIGKYEVTQELWEAVMGNNPSCFKGARRPVENVSWDDCQVFIRKLNRLTGQTFRLPTEAQWEFAARGGNSSFGYKYSGNYFVDNVAWYGDNSGDTTHDVGNKSSNELGILDMSGNVYEWCSDWYGAYDPSSSGYDPVGPSDGCSRVIRGGSCVDGARLCRVSDRNHCWPGERHFSIGLRLCL